MPLDALWCPRCRREREGVKLACPDCRSPLEPVLATFFSETSRKS